MVIDMKPEQPVTTCPSCAHVYEKKEEIMTVIDDDQQTATALASHLAEVATALEEYCGANVGPEFSHSPQAVAELAFYDYLRLFSDNLDGLADYNEVKNTPFMNFPGVLKGAGVVQPWEMKAGKVTSFRFPLLVDVQA